MMLGLSDKKLNMLMPLALLILALSSLTRFVPRFAVVSENTLDATQGFLTGVAIGLLLLNLCLRAKFRVTR